MTTTEPTTEQTPPIADSAMDTFDKHMAALGATPDVAAGDAPKQTEKAEPEKAKGEADPEKRELKSFGDIPAELIEEPKKAAVEEKPSDEVDKLLTETPTGQIKHDHFKRVQTAAKAEVERVRAELESLKEQSRKANEAPAQSNDELEKLRKTLAEREELIERIAYEKSPRFQSKFTAKETALRDSITRVGKEYGLSEDDIAPILAASGKRRDAMIDELDIADGAKRRLDAHLVNLDQLGAEKEQELSRSRDELKAHNEELRAQQEAADAKARQEEDRVFGEALKEAHTKLAAFRKIDGNDAWNEEVEKRADFARNFFNGGASLKEMAELALLGMDHAIQVKIIGGLRAELAALKEQNGKLSAATPNAGNPPNYRPDDSTLSPEERAMNTFDRHLAAARG